ncbi:transglutaminase family protein [Salipiger sp. IMCC34102]|nr:transglutaminase family protein [Salipiger sp. IMCC34102]
MTDPHQVVTEELFDVPDHVTWRDIAGEEGIGSRIWMDVEDRLDLTYEARVAVERTGADIASLPRTPNFQLNAEDVKYLMASRYCRASGFEDFLDDFAHLDGGAKVKAMSDWITANLTYDNGASNSETTAQDTFDSRRGVCRDYAHLLIALCRCSAIPARIVSVYSPEVTPPDFHAVAEVYLDGGWHLVDPSGMSTPDRMVVCGVGRDAADVSFLTGFGALKFVAQSVSVTPAAKKD